MLVLWVAFGGALGAVVRYLLGAYVITRFGTFFPYATLFINITGSAAIGICSVMLTKLPFSSELCAFMIVGILGGYTTFSSFSLELVTLYQKGQIYLAFLYAFGSVCLAFFSTALGIYCTQQFLLGKSG